MDKLYLGLDIGPVFLKSTIMVGTGDMIQDTGQTH